MVYKRKGGGGGGAVLLWAKRGFGILDGQRGGGGVVENRKAVAPEKMRSRNTIPYPRVRASHARTR